MTERIKVEQYRVPICWIQKLYLIVAILMSLGLSEGHIPVKIMILICQGKFMKFKDLSSLR